MGSVSLMSGDVMELEIVWMDLMKWIALVGILPVFLTLINYLKLVVVLSEMLIDISCKT